MGLPISIRNINGKKATIELNEGDFVVCRYGMNNSVYLNDAKLNKCYPANWFKRLIYELRSSGQVMNTSKRMKKILCGL